MAKLQLQTKKLTPRQAVMIALLAAVLLAVVYWPGDEAATLDAGGGSLRTPPGAAARLANLKAKALPKAKQWPQPDLEAALQHDPFSSPLLSRKAEPQLVDEQPNAVDEAADLLALRQDGVSMIVRDGAGMVATVGERKLRVGDVIDGYRVVAIEMDGVVLERVKTE